jgi:hypothetical protein
MDKIIDVRYWKTVFPDLPYKHGQEFKYTSKNRNKIIDTCIEKGYSVMVRPTSKENGWLHDGIIIWIDKGRFGQS